VYGTIKYGRNTVPTKRFIYGYLQPYTLQKRQYTLSILAVTATVMIDLGSCICLTFVNEMREEKGQEREQLLARLTSEMFILES
jgi:adenylylsulfate kinase-like enzyme